MKSPVHPAVVMTLFWCFILCIYFVGPVSLTPEISLQGSVFLFAHISLFIAGSGLAFILFNKRQHTPQTASDDALFTPLLLLMGVTGGLVSIYNNFIAIQDINLASIATLRAIKAQNLLHGGQSHGGLLSALAYVTYPAGFVGLVAGVIEYERLSRFARLSLYVFVGIIFCVAILAGGRSPILLLLLFIGISCYTRTRLGKSWMPNSRTLKMGAALLLLIFMVYSSIMWSVRAAESSRTAEQALQYAGDVGGAKPKPYLLRLNNPGFELSALNTVFYLTQSLQVTEKILAAREDIPALYGSYHIDMVAAALRLFPQGSAFLKEHYTVLMKAKIYGYFTGAWGGLFIDYGYFSLLGAMIWGFLAGMAWVNFKHNPGVLTGLFYVFWNYSILISFATPPFGFSNSLVVFGWFLVFDLGSRWLDKKGRAPRAPTLDAC